MRDGVVRGEPKVAASFDPARVEQIDPVSRMPDECLDVIVDRARVPLLVVRKEQDGKRVLRNRSLPQSPSQDVDVQSESVRGSAE